MNLDEASTIAWKVIEDWGKYCHRQPPPASFTHDQGLMLATLIKDVLINTTSGLPVFKEKT